MGGVQNGGGGPLCKLVEQDGKGNLLSLNNPCNRLESSHRAF